MIEPSVVVVKVVHKSAWRMVSWFPLNVRHCTAIAIKHDGS
jgi:hypothetical protein